MAKRSPHVREWNDTTSKAAIKRSEPDEEECPDGATTVYYLHSPDHELLYVGISAAALGIARFQGHAADKDWWDEVGYISVEHMPSRAHAQRREAAAIEALNPKYNVVRPNFSGCANCGQPAGISRRRECGACAEYRRRNGKPRPKRLYEAVKHGA